MSSSSSSSSWWIHVVQYRCIANIFIYTTRSQKGYVTTTAYTQAVAVACPHEYAHLSHKLERYTWRYTSSTFTFISVLHTTPVVVHPFTSVLPTLRDGPPIHSSIHPSIHESVTSGDSYDSLCWVHDSHVVYTWLITYNSTPHITSTHHLTGTVYRVP